MKLKLSLYCPTRRRKLMTTGTLNINTGTKTITKFEWRVEACNALLWRGTPEYEAQECAGCRTGWTHPHNHPASKPEEGCKGCDECNRAS